jgi:IclR family pca regulon transcriptional regulator
MIANDPDAVNHPVGVRSLARGLRIIVAMGEKSYGMTLSEVAEAVGLDRATTRRFLMTLQELGYVALDDRRYVLLPRILDLGYAYLSSTPVWQMAVPSLQRVADATNENCSIGVLDRGDVMYIARAQSGARKMTMNIGIGARLPAFCTSMGRVLLAGLAPPALDAYLATLELRAYTQYTVRTLPELRAAIDAARDRGWCFTNQEMEHGIRSIAVPLHDRSGTVVAAMNVSIGSSVLDEATITTTILERLQATAREIDGALHARAYSA